MACLMLNRWICQICGCSFVIGGEHNCPGVRDPSERFSGVVNSGDGHDRPAAPSDLDAFAAGLKERFAEVDARGLDSTIDAFLAEFKAKR